MHQKYRALGSSPTATICGRKEIVPSSHPLPSFPIRGGGAVLWLWRDRASRVERHLPLDGLVSDPEGQIAPVERFERSRPGGGGATRSNPRLIHLIPGPKTKRIICPSPHTAACRRTVVG